jgi:hypothetical protein
MAGFTYGQDMFDASPNASSEPFQYGMAEEKPAQPSTNSFEMPIIGPGGESTGYTEMVEAKEPKKFENLPTIAEMPLTTVPSYGKTAKTQLGMMFSSTPEGAANILQKNVPGVRFSYDKYDNPVAIVPDDKGVEQAYHLDKPGINALDFSRFVGKSVSAVPAALAAAYIAPASSVGIPLSLAMQGATAGISSIGEDVLSNVLGSEETPDLGKAALSTVIGAAGPVAGEAAKSLAGLWKPDVFNSMSRGAQNFLKYISGKLSVGDIPIPKDGRDIILDTPQFRALAKSIIEESPDSAAAKTITNLIQARDAATPVRVRDEVNRAIGRATVSEREADEAYKQYMRTLSGEETPLLQNAPPIDPSAIVQKIDSMLETAQGKTASALQRIRSFFVESEGTLGTKASVNEIRDPNTGAVIRREHVPAQEGKPVSYKTDAQSLESARVEIDSLIHNGDKTLGIEPGELRGRKGAIGSIRNDLSSLLKDKISGYEKVMGKYADTYALIEANEIGQNLFAGGQKALRPDEVKLFMKDPEQGSALRSSVRSLINNKLNGPAEEVMSLKRMLGGAEGYNRKSLENIFGEKEINRLSRLVDRELEFRLTSKSLLPAREAAQGAEMSKAFASDVGDIELPHTLSQAGSLAMKPISTARRLVKGTQGPEFREDLSKFMTTPAENLPAYARGFQKSVAIDEAIKKAQGFTPFVQNLPSASIGRERDEQVPRKAGGSVGRIGRASGGKVSHDIAPLVSRLMGLANQAKKATDNNTKPLLDAPDESIVKALRVANQAI